MWNERVWNETGDGIRLNTVDCISICNSVLVLLDLNATFDIIDHKLFYRDWRMLLGLKEPHLDGLSDFYHT